MTRNRQYYYSQTIPHFRSKSGSRTEEPKASVRLLREVPRTGRERRRRRRENLISLNMMKRMIMLIIIRVQNLITYRYKSI